MRNLETLYSEDGAFRVDAIKHAADYIGTTSVEFAEKWLTHEPEPAEDVNGTADGARTAQDAKSDVSPVDSRTQLIADIQAWLEGNVGFSVWLTDLMEQVYGWLDRQAAITEREHPGLTISDDESLINWHGKNYMLQSRVLNAERERDEFSLKLKHEMELNRDSRNALDLERIAELQAEIDRLQRRNDELRTSYDKLKRERDNLADDLLACNREREQLRKHLGIALDHAHDICSLVDIDGNVLDGGD